MADLREDPYPDVYIGGGFSDPTDLSGPAGCSDPAHPRPTGPPAAGPGPTADPPHAPARQEPDRPPREPDRPGRLLRRCGPVLRTGWTTSAVAAGAALLMVGHPLVPNRPGNIGSLLETLLPWTGLVVPALLLTALLRRSVPAVIAALLLGAVWIGVFGPLFLGGESDTKPNLTVVTHNVGATNPDPTATARTLLAADPDLVALEEITDDALPAYREVLDRRLPHSVHIGTVALWSRYPLAESRRVTIDPGWSRSLRARVQAPDGPLAVYVVHLPSVRVGAAGFTIGRRDAALTALDRMLDHERQKKVLLLGDLNGATTDRRLAPLMSRLTSVEDEAGSGFGFSWPAAFPIARVDHILVRDVTPTDAWTLPATGSDHRPVAAALRT
ncbi:endonuclease/exonuclease/phosphatase family protein [Streptomyces sp. NBC_00376]|uniref:endonuclease/exonuclease/phosphatase family protein n=1 Tax=Streptomyces sp. NBC_00376 TaxID=2975730 RepID=UPI002E1A6A93